MEKRTDRLVRAVHVDGKHGLASIHAIKRFCDPKIARSVGMFRDDPKTVGFISRDGITRMSRKDIDTWILVDDTGNVSMRIAEVFKEDFVPVVSVH